MSVEVSPALAHDEAGTVEAARSLDDRIDAPNLYVKVPATAEGIPAIRTLISEGRSINVTLIFGLDRYREVMEAYISGLEACEAEDLSSISSVASFFISRVDVEVDRRLEEIGTDEALALRGKAAIAQGQLAYQLFLETFRGDRWQALEARGARLQRPLWASTSTKNPDYPDTLYVDTLIGPNTVNTLPDSTLLAFEDHGTVARTVGRRSRRCTSGDGRSRRRGNRTSTRCRPSSRAKASPASPRASTRCSTHSTTGPNRCSRAAAAEQPYAPADAYGSHGRVPEGFNVLAKPMGGWHKQQVA